MVLLFILSLLQALNTTRGSIEGIVLKSGTVVQQSLTDARLELTDGPGTPLVVRSDVSGRFVFANLLPGRYRLTVTKDGFIRQQYKSRLTLTAGQKITDILFRLDPAPTISGRVQDELGDAIADVLVQALRRTYDARGNPTLKVVASGLTDDRGQYRIFWLDPGEYFLFVSSLPRSSQDDSTLLAQRSVPPTYYPGVADPASSKSVRLEIAHDADGLDFRLRRTSITVVKGQLFNSANSRPLVGAITLAPPPDVPSPLRYRASTDNLGTFVIDEPVAPGAYIALARSGSRDDLIGFERIEIRALPLLPPPIPEYVIRMRLAPPMQINGRFFVESGGTVDFRRARASLTAIQSGVPAITGQTQADGRFSVRGLVNDSYLVSVSGLEEDAYLKAAILGDMDVLRTPLSLEKQPSSSLPLQILLASDGGRMNVAVVDAENHPFEAAQIVLAPDPARRQRPDQYRTATSGEDGQATIRAIPPGDYKLFAFETIEPNAYLNKDYLGQYERLGVDVRVAPASSISRVAIAIRQ